MDRQMEGLPRVLWDESSAPVMQIESGRERPRKRGELNSEVVGSASRNHDGRWLTEVDWEAST